MVGTLEKNGAVPGTENRLAVDEKRGQGVNALTRSDQRLMKIPSNIIKFLDIFILVRALSKM